MNFEFCLTDSPLELRLGRGSIRNAFELPGGLSEFVVILDGEVEFGIGQR